MDGLAFLLVSTQGLITDLDEQQGISFLNLDGLQDFEDPILWDVIRSHIDTLIWSCFLHY